jgi:hypothetical protein
LDAKKILLGATTRRMVRKKNSVGRNEVKVRGCHYLLCADSGYESYFAYLMALVSHALM